MSDHSCRDDVCITCSDQLVEALVLDVSADGGTARAVCDGAVRELSVELLDGVAPGDRLLVHGGVALQRAAVEGAT